MTEQDLVSMTWRLDAHAGHWLTDDELTAVTDWMADHQLDRVTAQRPLVVEHGTITYGQDRSDVTVRAAHREIVTTTVPLRTAPPKVWQPDCAAAVMAELQETFDRHEWSSGFGGVCVTCSHVRIGEDGRVWCHRDAAAPWPCPPIREVLHKAAIPVPAAAAGSEPRRILGDCLSPAANATVFGHHAGDAEGTPA